MQFDLAQDFPVGIEKLWTALGQADYIERKYRSLGSTSIRLLKFSADAESIEVRLERLAPVAVDELPIWARVIAGKQQAMRHHTRWTRTGPQGVDVELEIRALGLPAAARGTGSVVELSPGRSRMTLHFDVSCELPAMASRVARLFAQQVKHALEADHVFTLDHLAAESGARAART